MTLTSGRLKPSLVERRGIIQKWEYLIVKANVPRDFMTLSYGRREGVISYMDAMGGEGWELVSVIPCGETDDETRLFFKRPVVEKN